jgi:hypothetical protein
LLASFANNRAPHRFTVPLTRPITTSGLGMRNRSRSTSFGSPPAAPDRSPDLWLGTSQPA